jgi:hypothetical protein
MSHTICIPSHKVYADSIDSINSAILFSQQSNSKINISDNSQCIIKLDYFTNIKADNLYYKNTKGFDLTNNWFSTLENVSTEFLSFLSDDDLILNISNNSINYSEIDQSIVAIRPSVNYWAKDVGIYNSSNFAISETNATSRLKNYLDACNGHNSTLFSAYRSEIIIPLYQLFNDHHPTRSGYTDWSLVFALISSGRLITDPNYSLTYKNTNWYGTHDFINKNIQDLFILADLPEKSAILLPLFKALDSFIFIMRSFSPLEYSEKINAASFILLYFINQFLSLDRFHLTEFTVKETELFSNLANCTTVNSALTTVLQIISCQRDDLNFKYSSFYYHSLKQEFGSLR